MSFGLKRLACATAVIVVVAACDTPPPAGPTPQARLAGGSTIAGQLISFASSRAADLFQTFVMKANGTKLDQLTFQPFYNARPDWSHDGSKITFTACRAGDDSCEIYVMKADGSAQTNVTHNFATDHMSVWSPDGRTIAFSSDRDGNFEIYVMNADGSNPVRLTYDDAADLYPGWSPDGRKITFESDRDGNSEIYVMNADGSSPVNVTHNPAADVRPRWSPRGNRIAFDSDRDGNEEIYVMRSDGSGQTRLTHNAGDDYGPAWSPGADALAFTTNRDGNYEIYMMLPDGSQPTRLTNNPAWDADPTWAIALVRTLPEPDPTSCVPSGTQQDINNRLRQPGDVALLCAGAVFELTSPVVFSADGQQIHTDGFPTDDRRARLRLASEFAATAVYMLDRSNVVLSHVIVDGNQPNLGPAPGGALILAGGSVVGQVIRNVQAVETRSWTSIHVFEGGAPHCASAVVENNEIGPSGAGSGIGFACTNSVLRNNTITDVSGEGIVVFGAPGSLVEGNVIRAESRMLFGGINMVDFGPYDGDYTGTRVHANVIDAAGAPVRVAVGMGYHVWFCVDPNDPTDRTLFGATVTDNRLQGAYMGYGFAVDGVRDWTVTGNQDLATHSGTPIPACNGQAPSPPAGFQKHGARALGTFQPEFVEASLEFAVGSIID
jgi:Tol biopolymer transport system component